ncbi:MAG: ABC transporter substrate-binding protein [Oscillospiraceae bacterium]|nr:ABC transporter substrate-binding protein [Oscillospiraceae bacterium]
MPGKKLLSAVLCCLLLLSLLGCGGSPRAEGEGAGWEEAGSSQLELQYAQQFSVDCFSDGSALLTIAGTDRFLIVPEGCEPPDGLDSDVVILRQPIRNIYLASSSAADLFLQLDALDDLRLTSTTAANWRLPEMQEAVETGQILYTGKYSAPDFEQILSEGCGLVIENTMIYRSPEIKEKLEDLGLPVLVEHSSYESHPLGRVEWIKVYGLLVGKSDEADRFFDRQVQTLSALNELEETGQTVAFFHINSAGAAVVRKPGDYVSKMIELAGGQYVFSALDSDDNALSTVNMQMETFYAEAKDADILIYNSTIDGEIDTLEQLLEKSSLLADFKAVQNGNVWCTEQNMFQQTSAAAGMISDINAILTGEADALDQLTFLHRLT